MPARHARSRIDSRDGAVGDGRGRDWSLRLIAVGAGPRVRRRRCGGTPTPERDADARPATATPAAPDPHLTEPATADAVFRALNAAGLKLVAEQRRHRRRARAARQADRRDVRRLAAHHQPVQFGEGAGQGDAWKSGAKPGQGEPPIAFKGLNILVEWGPTTGATAAEAERRASGPPLAALIEAIDRSLSPLQTRSNIKVTLPSHAAPSPAPSPTAGRHRRRRRTDRRQPMPRETTGP